MNTYCLIEVKNGKYEVMEYSRVTSENIIFQALMTEEKALQLLAEFEAEEGTDEE